MDLRIERVTALPATISPSTMYIVRAAEAGLAEIYFSNNDGSEVRHVINKQEITAMMTGAISDFTNIQLAADIAARNALGAALTRNALVLVTDATGDATVTAGAAMYFYDNAGAAWIKVSEFESLDVTLTWDAIVGKPSSTAAQIDAAVANSHTHANKLQLDKIGEDAQGKLLYNGARPEAPVAVASW